MTVVVTGVGAVTPVGDTAAETWAALLAGESGVGVLDGPRWDGLPVRLAATLRTDPADRLDRVEARNLDRSQRVALVAARDAWADAGSPKIDPERLAVVVGTGIGGAHTLLDQWDVQQEKGPRRVSPFTVPMLMPNGPAGVIGLDLGAQGPVRATVSACASGADAIALAYDTIAGGHADVVVAGGTEACVHPLPLAGFAQMRALSSRHDDPQGASRPFDADRDGFVMGEGAGILVLESAEHAAARGATGYAVLAGYGITADSHHLTAPEPTGAGAARAMRAALAMAGLAPGDVGYVNAHATSTPIGDVAEAAAIRSVVGAVPVSATKSMTGHLLGAAGAVEAIVTALSVRDGVVHPTRNYEKPDEQCDVDCVPEGARRVALAAALSNSFGFGGHNVSLAFRRVS